ncbi:selenide, water dikinase SelD [bacterium]|nr:selenide, water dikinase SelD [bacterium]
MLKHFPQLRNDDLLVGPEHGADAGVFRLTPELAIVQSADFFPPHVSDAHAFGQIAAANALSDIYAMGATPVTALNLLATPAKEDQAHLLSILGGAREKLAEAGAVIAGGHTITARTIMFGCAVTGVVHPDQVLRNTTPRPGDVLVLTKPLGTGVIIHGHATGDTSDAELDYTCLVMAELNKLAGEALIPLNAHASTDITGFGLIGHALDMLALGQAGMVLRYDDVPLLPRVMELADRGNIPPGSRANAEFTACRVDYGAAPDSVVAILNDAQTSGGLLVSLSPDSAKQLIARLAGGGYPYEPRIIGYVTDEHAGNIKVECQ